LSAFFSRKSHHMMLRYIRCRVVSKMKPTCRTRKRNIFCPLLLSAPRKKSYRFVKKSQANQSEVKNLKRKNRVRTAVAITGAVQRVSRKAQNCRKY
jgi:hypothetical protein